MAFAVPFALSGALSSAFGALIRYDTLYRSTSIMPNPLVWLLIGGIFGLPWLLPVPLTALMFVLAARHYGARPKWRLSPLTKVAFLWLGLSLIWILYSGRFYPHYAIFIAIPATVSL